jgi:hypothetical protein
MLASAGGLGGSTGTTGERLQSQAQDQLPEPGLISQGIESGIDARQHQQRRALAIRQA